MRVIGLDPGLRRMGWGVVAVDGPRLAHVANGTCLSGDGDLADRLGRLFVQLRRVIEEHAPDAAAVEQTFVNKDAVATLKLGQARGVALVVPALLGLSVAEYAPNAVKKAVVGTGHAQKPQIQHMIKTLLPGVALQGPDAADALAVAVCHAFHHRAPTARGLAAK